MARQRLSKLDDFQLVHSSQDIRGHGMMDASGDQIGTVADLIVDTDAMRVVTVVLDDGREVSAADIDIEDQRAYLRGAPAETPSRGDAAGARAGRSYDETHVHQGDAAFSDYAEAYRSHHRSTYGDAPFTEHEPAYRHGYEYGTAERYAGRDYDALEPEMRRAYEERHGQDAWEEAKVAVRHGFEHVRRQRTGRGRTL